MSRRATFSLNLFLTTPIAAIFCACSEVRYTFRMEMEEGASDTSTQESMSCYGIPGKELSETTAGDLKNLRHPSIILFSRNIETSEQTKELISSIRKALGVDTKFFVDCEGGWVNRLKHIDMIKDQNGITPTNPQSDIPSAVYFGNLYSQHPQKAESELYNHAVRLAGVMRELGFTHNLAPVVDLGCTPLDKYGRAYSSDPKIVSALSKIFMKAMVDMGIVPVIKHLPGLHFLGEVDTHEGIAHSRHSREEIASHLEMCAELCEYIRVALQITPWVMLNHGVYDGFGSRISVSLDPKIYEYLAEKLGYDVAFITDDLNMKGVTSEELGPFLEYVKGSKLRICPLFCHALTEGKVTKDIL